MRLSVVLREEAHSYIRFICWAFHMTFHLTFQFISFQCQTCTDEHLLDRSHSYDVVVDEEASVAPVKTEQTIILVALAMKGHCHHCWGL